MHAQRCYIRAALFNQLRVAVTHRVWHGDERQSSVAHALGCHLREWRERSAHHGDGGDAETFEFGRVTRGPWG